MMKAFQRLGATLGGATLFMLAASPAMAHGGVHPSSGGGFPVLAVGIGAVAVVALAIGAWVLRRQR